MNHNDKRLAAAIGALPALPRTLFRLHNFHDVGVAIISERIATDDTTILACLAEARSMIHDNYPDSPRPRFDPDSAGLPIARLEQKTRGEYRASLEATFAECGYAGVIPWSDLSAGIEADEDAAATFIVSHLRPPLRQAVARWRRTGVPIAKLWRRPTRWRRIARGRLLEVTSELRSAGWEAFEPWLAGRIAPDRHYPDGIVKVKRLRCPLVDEGTPSEGWSHPLWPNDPDRQARFDSLPLLARNVYALSICYGRSHREIAERLAIGRQAVQSQWRTTFYMVEGWPLPSRAWSIRFDLKMRWSRRLEQVQQVWTALHDDL